MSAGLLYLSRGDVRALSIAPREAREAVLQAFLAMLTEEGLIAGDPGPGEFDDAPVR